VSHIYCQECGFQNPESANYCARCGALLEKELASDETTVALEPDGEPEEGEDSLDDLGIKGPALVVRSGGGRAGEVFDLEGDGIQIGRSPDCDIFLDDVTVSRRHAVLTHQESAWLIEDQGSLNGTFVNRRRVESGILEDGDELQIGKYRLTYLNR
jgi:pSer/pThr/pTyr-binding forkhead associated (FHA) protein